MESIKLRSRVDADGVLTIRMPPSLKERDVEVVLVIQLLDSEEQKLTITETSEKKATSIRNNCRISAAKRGNHP